MLSRRWLRKHRSELSACGIPADVAGAERRWVHLLLHGYDAGSAWSNELLTAEPAAELLALLDPHFRNPVGIWLVEALRRRQQAGER